MSDLSEVLKRLPSLSASDLAKVGERLRALGSGTVGDAVREPSGQRWEAFLLDCIMTVFREHLGASPSRQAVQRMNAYKTFQRGVPALAEFLDKAADNHAQRQAIARVGVDLVYQYLSSNGRTVGIDTVLYRIHYLLPGVLESQFPGYARAGLLGMVARRDK